MLYIIYKMIHRWLKTFPVISTLHTRGHHAYHLKCVWSIIRDVSGLKRGEIINCSGFQRQFRVFDKLKIKFPFNLGEQCQRTRRNLTECCWPWPSNTKVVYKRWVLFFRRFRLGFIWSTTKLFSKLRIYLQHHVLMKYRLFRSCLTQSSVFLREKQIFTREAGKELQKR